MSQQSKCAFQKFIFLVSLLCIATMFNPAHADQASLNSGDVQEALGACGNLTRLGDKTFIYNQSLYAWDVVFVTSTVLLPIFRQVQPGAVKYFTNGVWKDPGYGANKYGAGFDRKTYRIPVPAGKTVPIAYCADSSYRKAIIAGLVEFVPGQADYNGARPVNGISFYGVNSAPKFDVLSVTPYVNFNRNGAAAFENGSIVICSAAGC